MASPMTKQIEVITPVERRRRWSRAEKERLVAAAIEPGAVASEIARAAGIATSQLFRWRRTPKLSVQASVAWWQLSRLPSAAGACPSTSGGRRS
jgi:transposase